MKKSTLLLVFALSALLGIQAQNITLPYTQDFSTLTSGGMDASSNSGSSFSGTLDGVDSIIKGYQAGEVLKLGTSSIVGGIYLSPVNAGTSTSIKVSFKAVPWTGNSPKAAQINVTYGGQTQTVDLPAATHSWPLTADDMLNYTVTFNSEASPAPISLVTVSSSSLDKRVFIDDLSVVAVSAPPAIVGDPLFEDFEGEEFPPLEWSAINISGSVEWGVTSLSSYVSGAGTSSATVKYSSSGHENILITPKLLPRSGDNLSFQIRTSSYFANTTLKVQVSTTTNQADAFTTTLLSLVDSDITTSWTVHTVDISAYVGQEIYIGFRVIDNNGMRVLLDSVSGPTLYVPSCPNVRNLNATDISSSGAEISWTEYGSASNWTVEYSTKEDFSSDVNSVEVTSQSTNLSGLNPNTAYYVRVKAVCSAGVDESDWTIKSFRTECDLVGLGWTENFDEANPNDSLRPYCWNMLSSYVSGSDVYPRFAGDKGHNAPGALACYFPVSNETDTFTSLFATPQFSSTFSNAQIVFWTNRTNPSEFEGVVELGVMSDLADTSTFVPIAVIETEYNTWKEHAIPLLAAPIGNPYIAFRITSSQTNTIYIDDILVREMPTCIKPVGVTIDNITNTSLHVSWSAGESGETEWVIEYKETEGDTWTVVSPNIMNTPEYTFTGLTSNTSYDVRVKAVCSVNDESEYTVVETVKTTCDPITSLDENFEATEEGLLPDCWNKYPVEDSLFPVVLAPSTYYSGLTSNAVIFQNEKPLYLITAPFNVPLNQLQLRFKLLQKRTQSGLLQVGYMSGPSDVSSFVPIASYTNVETGVMVEKVLNLNNVPDNGGANRYIAFRYGDVDNVTQSVSAYYIIDDVKVVSIPSCLQPASISVGDVTPTSIDISWIAGGSETEWVVEYKLANDDTWTAVSPNVTTTPECTVNGLNPASAYNIRVKSVCSSTESSEYRELETVVYTSCSTVSLLNENFDAVSDALPICWSRITSDSEPKVVPANSYYGLSSKAIRFSGNKPQFLVTPEFSRPIRELLLEFKLDREGTSCGILQVGYMSDPSDANTFVPIHDYQPSVYKTMVSYRLQLNNVPDSTNGVANRYIAFRYGDVGTTIQNTSYYYWIDDVVLSEAPSCLMTTNVELDTVVQTSATISFTANSSETNWQYAYTDDMSVNDPSTLTPIDFNTNPLVVSNLVPETSYKVWIRANCGSGDFSEWTEEPLQLTTLPTCFTPTNLIVEAPTENSAHVTWVAGESETAWTLEYKVSSDSVWTSVANLNDTTYEMQGLTSNTSYDVRVQSNCSSSDASAWTEIVTFTTECGIFSIPFTEDFSSGHVPPSACWSKYKGLASSVFAGQPYEAYNYGWTTNDNDQGLPSVNARLNVYGNNCKSWLVTPQINVTSQAGAVLEFDLALTKYGSSDAPEEVSSDDKFMVIVSTDGGNTWVEANATIWAEDGTGDYVFSQIPNTGQRISLNIYHSGIIKLAFYGESTISGGDNNLHIDNISLTELIVTPAQVVTQPADNVTTTTATLHKMVTAGSEAITSEGFRYKVASDNVWRSSTDGNLTALAQGTTYDFFAYAVAGGVTYTGDTLQFTTEGQAAIPPTVTTEAATDIQYTSAKLNKTVVADPSEPVVSEGWKYKAVSAGSWSTTTDANLTNLLPATQYEFYAYATTAVNLAGYNGDTLTFTTLTHTMPTVVTEDATNITHNSAILHKTLTAGSEDIIAEGWKYRVVGSAIWVDSSDGNLTGLQANTEYEFKAYASTATYSNVEGDTLTFTTLEQSVGIGLVEYSVKLYPNPTNDVVTIQVEGLDEAAEVTILDLQGKVLSRHNLDSASNSLIINVSELADATYIVRIKSENVNITKRLIIKK